MTLGFTFRAPSLRPLKVARPPSVSRFVQTLNEIAAASRMSRRDLERCIEQLRNQFNQPRRENP